jgi:mannose-6-phosphate isomerase-like protein (cupin superfamily)
VYDRKRDRRRQFLEGIAAFALIGSIDKKPHGIKDDAMKIVMAMVAAAAIAAPAATLTGDKALVIPAQDIKAQFAELIPQAKPTGIAGPVVASYGKLSLMLSVRTQDGVGELHQNVDDLMIVEQGTATLITGGTLVDPKPIGDGEIRGTKVINGTSKKIGVGDVVIIPAGIPHQILVPAGTAYTSLMAKIKEQ